jgi:hypothetical protein
MKKSFVYDCTACGAAGKKYKNDPTILAWNLINEPRCETWVPANSWCPATLAAWFKVRLCRAWTACTVEVGLQACQTVVYVLGRALRRAA